MGAFDDLVPLDTSQSRGVTQVSPGVYQDAKGVNYKPAPDLGPGYFRDANGNQLRDTTYAPPAPAGAAPAPAPGAFDDLVPSHALADGSPFAATSPFAEANRAGRNIAEGVPILGQLANQADAATNATLAPAVEPLLDMIPGHDKSQDINSPDWSDRYSRALAWQRGMDADSAQAHPILTGAEKVGGGLAAILASDGMLSPATAALGRAAPAAGLVPRMLAGALDGGALGGGMGYLNQGAPIGPGAAAWNDPSRISDTELSGALGGGLGAAAGPLSKLLGAAWKGTAGKLSDMVQPQVTLGGAAPTLADALSPPAAAGPEAQALASAIHAPVAPTPVTVPRSAANAAFDLVQKSLARGRADAATPAGALAQVDTLGPHASLADVSVPLQDVSRTVAETPGQGGQIAQDALNTRQLGVMSNGQYTVPPASQRIGDTLASALGVSDHLPDAEAARLIASQKAAAGPAYAKAYSAPAVPTSALQDLAQSPMFSDAYARARAISQTDIVPQPDGSLKLQPLPPKPGDALDWRTLDLMKQGMDDTYREGQTSGIGANAQRATQGFRNAFVQRLDSINPDYAAARAAFSGPAQSLDTLQAGRDFMSDDASHITSQMGQLSPSDQQLYRLGAVQAVRDQLGNVPTTYNAAGRTGVITPMKQAKLASLFPDQQSYGQFSNMLQGEDTMFQTRARVLGGSQTSRNLAGQEDAGIGEAAETAGHLVGAAHGEPSSMMALLGKLISAGKPSLSEPTANAAASILFTPGAHLGQDIQTGLEAAARRKALADVLSGARPATAGFAGAAAAPGFNQGAPSQ